MTAKEGTQRETNCHSTCPAWQQTHGMSFHNHRTCCYFVLIFPIHWYWTSDFTKNGYLMAAVKAREPELVALESCDLISPWPAWESVSKGLTWHRPRQTEDIRQWFHRRNWAFVISLGTERWTAKVKDSMWKDTPYFSSRIRGKIFVFFSLAWSTTELSPFLLGRRIIWGIETRSLILAIKW